MNAKTVAVGAVLLGGIGLAAWALTRNRVELQWDVNGDGSIDAGDIVALELMYGPVTDDTRQFDFNRDGIIDDADSALLEQKILGII